MGLGVHNMRLPVARVVDNNNIAPGAGGRRLKVHTKKILKKTESSTLYLKKKKNDGTPVLMA